MVLDETNEKRIREISREPDRKFYFHIGMDFVTSPEYHPEDLYPIDVIHKLYPEYEFLTPRLNGINFLLPQTPLLYQQDEKTRALVCNQENYSKFCVNKDPVKYCSCTQVQEVKLNDLVEIVLLDPFNSNSHYSHPMHVTTLFSSRSQVILKKSK